MGMFRTTPNTNSTTINVHKNFGQVGHIGSPFPRTASRTIETNTQPKIKTHTGKRILKSRAGIMWPVNSE